MCGYLTNYSGVIFTSLLCLWCNKLCLVKQSLLPGRASKLLWVMLTSGGQVIFWGVTTSEFRVLSRKGTARPMTGRTKLFSGMSRGKI